MHLPNHLLLVLVLVLGLLVRNCSGEGVFRLLLTRDVGDRKEAPLNPNRDYYLLD